MAEKHGNQFSTEMSSLAQKFHEPFMSGIW